MVVTRILLNEEGFPQDVIILKSPNNKFKDAFEEAGKDAIMKGQLTPAYMGDRAVTVWMQYIIRFKP